jgi:GNAT superfamily N-acetyltransferase
MDGGERPEAERVLSEERAFVLAMGGFSIEIAGASLVTHEKVPVPRFNFVEVRNVGRERQAAFFERALDHYFQRALRPTFRTASPAPAHVDAGLRRFGFRPSEFPLELLAAPPSAGPEPTGPFRVVTVGPEELARILPFWTDERERDEFARAIEVLVHHPNLGERLAPLIAERDGDDVAAALLYAHGRTAGIHGVATTPRARGLGAASALVAHALAHSLPPEVDLVGMVADHPRIARRLLRLGFREVGALTEYTLPRDVELAMPPPGPPTPPRWRPPRKAPPDNAPPG